MYTEVITQLCINTNVIRNLARGYLPITLITHLKLKVILNTVRNTVRKTNFVIKRLHPYYDIKLVTFGIDSDRNLIVQFTVSIQPYTQQPLILYQIEIASVSIIDQNTQAHSYTSTGRQSIHYIELGN